MGFFSVYRKKKSGVFKRVYFDKIEQEHNDEKEIIFENIYITRQKCCTMFVEGMERMCTVGK